MPPGWLLAMLAQDVGYPVAALVTRRELAERGVVFGTDVRQFGGLIDEIARRSSFLILPSVVRRSQRPRAGGLAPAAVQMATTAQASRGVSIRPSGMPVPGARVIVMPYRVSIRRPFVIGTC